MQIIYIDPTAQRLQMKLNALETKATEQVLPLIQTTGTTNLQSILFISMMYGDALYSATLDYIDTLNQIKLVKDELKARHDKFMLTLRDYGIK